MMRLAFLVLPLLLLGCDDRRNVNYPANHPLNAKTWRLACPYCGRQIYEGPSWPDSWAVDYKHVEECPEKGKVFP